MSGLAALSAGCGSATSDTVLTPGGPVLPVGPRRSGRGGRPLTPEQVANAFQALDPLVLKGSGFLSKVNLPPDPARAG